MTEQAPRLGDLIDDYCPRCRLLLNHAIASMIQGQVMKVICQTCFTEHAYRRGEGGKKKPVNSRATLFEQVLAKAPVVADPAMPAPPKKRNLAPARYISRHKDKPAGKGK